MPLKLKLKTSDNKIIEVEEHLARMSTLLSSILDEDSTRKTEVIPLKEITAPTLALVLQWCRQHVADPVDIYASDEEAEGYGFQLIAGRYRWRRQFVVVPKWDQAFLAVDNSTLFSIVNAAHHLQIKKLLDYSCHTVADKMRNKSAEQIREEFNIQNDLEEDDDDIKFEGLDMSRTGKFVMK